MNRSSRNKRSNRLFVGIARRRRWVALMAAAPVFQLTGCFPDPIGALNFELQNLFSTAIIDVISVVVSNVLRL